MLLISGVAGSVCLSSTCLNGGSCGESKCICPHGKSGHFCQWKTARFLLRPKEWHVTLESMLRPGKQVGTVFAAVPENMFVHFEIQEKTKFSVNNRVNFYRLYTADVVWNAFLDEVSFFHPSKADGLTLNPQMLTVHLKSGEQLLDTVKVRVYVGRRVQSEPPKIIPPQKRHFSWIAGHRRDRVILYKITDKPPAGRLTLTDMDGLRTFRMDKETFDAYLVLGDDWISDVGDLMYVLIETENEFPVERQVVILQANDTEDFIDSRYRDANSYMLPRTKEGCPLPDRFNDDRKLEAEGIRFTLENVRRNATDLKLCRKKAKSLPHLFPYGEYCVFSIDDTCPKSLDTEVTLKVTSSADHDPLRQKFCCQTEGSVNRPESFPYTEDFFLLSLHKDSCQMVDGFEASRVDFFWTTDPAELHVDIERTGTNASFYRIEKNKIAFNMCIYRPPIDNNFNNNYMLPRTEDGCPFPDRFRDDRKLKAEGVRFFLENVQKNATSLTLCRRKATSVGYSFPKGKYCVFGTDKPCPSSLDTDLQGLYREYSSLLVGQQRSYLLRHSMTPYECRPPLAEVTVNVTSSTNHDPLQQKFCCQTEGKVNTEAYLRYIEDFYLLSFHRDSCQKVKGFVGKQVEFYWTTYPAYLHVQSTNNNASFYWIDGKKIVFNMCFYTKPTDNGPLIGGLIGANLFMVTSCVCYCRKRKKRRREKYEERRTAAAAAEQSHTNPTVETVPMEEESQRIHGKQILPLQIGSILKLILDPESQLKIHGLLIHPEKVEIGAKIGKGAFGTVFQGRYVSVENPMDNKEVAIKTLKDSCVYPEISAFMEEAIVMADFHHTNVLSIIGVSIKPETEIPTIVLPLMSNGDLQKYCRQFRYDDTMRDKTPDLQQLLSFALQISRGMDYLTGLKFVHRDLAARNCMLNGNMVVKVADFGLTKDIYSNNYYRQDKNKLLPIKWMALECLQDRVFTSYTDVWSFGVTVWEIFTLGKVPYPDLENSQVLPELEKGVRLPKPPTCPDVLFAQMERCWLENPKERPKFADICTALEAMMLQFTEYLDLEDKPKTNCDVTSGIIVSPEQLIDNSPPSASVYLDYRDISNKSS